MNKLLIGIVILGLVGCSLKIKVTNSDTPPVVPQPVPPVVDPTPVKQDKLSCLIIGDSIAVGVGQQLGGCATDAKVGIPSSQIVNKVKPATWLVISSGTNNATDPHLLTDLENTRKQATDHVVWILSQLKGARDAELAIANKYHDATVSFVAGQDHIHPHSYQTLSKDVLAKLR